MKQYIKDKIRYTRLWRTMKAIKSQEQIQAWNLSDRPSPPPDAVKVRNILSLADIFNLNILVETGTLGGQTIDATLVRFRQIYSIEIYEPLATKAIRKYSAIPKVEILHGDSAVLLPGLLAQISEPILFWLDGHYSGEGTGIGAAESPIIAEIDHILHLRQNFDDVIIIDDARCFTGSGSYPKLDDFVETLKRRFQRTIKVADDAIFVLPR
jgi:hypothetical protein